jgi:hypothetical protein
MTLSTTQITIEAAPGAAVISDPVIEQQLQQALSEACALLSALSARADAAELLQQAFGSAGTADADFQANVQALLQRLQAEGLQLTVELRSSAEMAGALGAYASVSPGGGERIYLNADWISAGASVEAIRRALLEEAGHAIDQRLNSGADAAGDEGELFSALISDEQLTQERLALIRAQDDTVQLQIDGQLVQAEAAVSSATISSITTDSGTAGDFITNDTTLSFGIAYTSTTSNPLSIWSQLGSVYTRLDSVSVSNNQTSATTSFNYTGTTLADGNYTFWLTATNASVSTWASVTDAQKLSSRSITIDATAPTIVITDNVSGTATEPITFTFTFSEDVSGFAASDITVSNGTKGTFTAVSATVYTLVVTPTASSSGDVTIDVAAGAATDAAGNNSAAPSQYSKPFDTAAPTVVITDDTAGVADGPVTFTFTFSEAVTGFTVDDITVGNGSKGTFTAVSSTVYTLVVTPTASTTGTITVDVAAGAASDAAGNASVAPTQYMQSFDTTSLTVSISDNVAGTATGPVTFTFTFSEAVTGFTADDITVGNGSKGTFTPVSGTVYTLEVAPTAASSGNITIDVPADAATNGTLGNRAPAQYVQAFDTAAPTVVITDNAAGNASGPVTFTFTFSEAVTGFTVDDITVGSGSKGTFTAVSSSVYTLSVTPSGTNGSITVDVAAAAASDAAGNASLAPQQYSQPFDTRAIRVTPGTYSLSSGVMSYELTTNGTGADLLVAVYADANGTSNLIGWQVINRAAAFGPSAVYQGAFDFSATQLAKLEASTISIRAWQGTAGSSYGTASDSSPGITYGTGTVAGGVATGFRINSTSNPNGGTDPLVLTGTPSANSLLVSGINTVTVDTAAPTLVITDNIPVVTNGPVTFTFTFSEAVSGFTAADITVGNGSKGTFTAVSSTVYTLEVTPTPGFTGDITVDVAAGAATDAVGNASVAPAQYPQAIDSTPPGVPVITSAAANSATNAVISGTAEAGSTITITLGGATYTTTAALVTGAWSLNTASATATSGSLTLVGNDPIVVTATDAAGNVSGAATQTLAPEQLGSPDLIDASDTGASQTDNLTSDTTPTFSGLGANPGATVFLHNTTSGNLEGSGVADASGNWSITVDTSLTDGSYAFAVRQRTDVSGNESPLSSTLTVTIDATAPTAPANSLTLQNDSGTLNDGITRNVPEFRLGDLLTSALAAPQVLSAPTVATPIYGIGDIIQIGYLDDNNAFVVSGASRPLIQDDFAPNGQLVQGTIGNGLGKSIQIALSGTLAPGNYQFVVRVVDPAGNASDLSPQAFPVALLDPADQPYVNVLAAAVDPSGINVGTAIAGFYFYNPEWLSSTALTVDFQDAADKTTGYFEIDASGSAIRLTAAGLQAYTNGLLSLPKDIRLALTGAAAPTENTDADTAVMQAAGLSKSGSLYYIDFVDAWLGAPVDRRGRLLSGSNPNQFNYFKSSSQLDPSGVTFRFVAAADQSGAVGNNVIGTLYVIDASGQQIGASVQGVLSRVNKIQGEVQAVYFYEGTDYPTTSQNYDPTKKMIILDLEGGIEIEDDEIYRTSSDLPRSLFTELTLDVNSIDVNEGNRYGVFAVDLISGQDVSLLLEDGSGNVFGNSAAFGGSSDPDDGSIDFRNDTLEFSLDNGATWIAYTGSVTAELAAGAPKMLVRLAIINDPVYEDAQNFGLKVAYTGVGFGSLNDTGAGIIRDDGTGALIALDASGNPRIDASGSPILDEIKPKDDDRGPILVTAFGPFNENSPFAIFSINAKPGLALNLELGNTSSLLDKDASIAGFTSFEYSTDGGASWITYSWNGSSGDRPSVPINGKVLVRVDITSERDQPYEGPETFTLSATYATGAQARGTGIATIIDNGTGDIVKVVGGNPEIDGSGVPVLDLEAVKDDDRSTLSIPDVIVNEASPYAVFQIFGAGGNTYRLALIDGAIDFMAPNDTGALGSQMAVGTASIDPSGFDFRTELQIYNGSTWVPYIDASGVSTASGASVLLVRVPLINDGLYEAAHAFTLTATDLSGNTPASGRAIISDFGTGLIFNDSGNENRGAVKDDDRALKVDSPIVNEASDFVVFRVRGITSAVELSLLFGNGTGFAALPTPDLHYWTGSAWQSYTPAAVLTPGTDFSTGSELYVRVTITQEQDDPYEGFERFTLDVSGAGGPSQGVATIRDDGTGDIPAFDTSGNLLLDSSGNLILDKVTQKDDDLDKDGIAPTTEDALSTLVASQNVPGAKPGDLNGDGTPDAEQKALATLAWLDVTSFSAGNEGTLTDFRPVISLIALEDASGTSVSNDLQLENIRVVDYNDATEFPSGGAVTTDASGTRTVPLASGGSATTAWDPLRFELAPVDGAETLTDIDPSRNGTQVRMFIDMRASGLDASTFNAYVKYVSQEAIDASGDLLDLSGTLVSTPGWYDFTQRTPGGDGARFVVSGGKIQGIEMILTDNAFGDNDPSLNRILDPGAPVFSPTVTELLPTEDGKGLKLIGSEGQSLWLDLSVLLSSAVLQNSYNLIRRTYSGQSYVDAAVGSIGATPGAGFAGDARIQLSVGEELRFALKSSNMGLRISPDIRITGQDNSYAIRLDDSDSTIDRDYNDLIINVQGIESNPLPLATQIAGLQTGMASPYLDLRWIPPQGVTLAVDVQTDNSARDVLRLVRLDPSRDFNQDGSPRGTVSGVAPTAGSAFDQSVRNALLHFSHSRSSPGTSNLSLSLSQAQAGVYMPVLYRSSGALYNAGFSTSADTWQRVRVLGANSFAFEAPTSAGPDWDYNDLVVNFRIAESTPRLTIGSGGRSLRVTGGSADQGLWLDLSAVMSSSRWQNNLDLIKVNTSSQRSAVGSIGTTANAIGSRAFGVYGSSTLFLLSGESLEFRENSNDNPVGSTPLLRITQVGERFVVAMDDRAGLGGTSDGDFNDLVLNIDSSVQPSNQTLDALTSFQRSSADGVLDLSGIDASGVRLELQVNSDSLDNNTLRFVRLDGGGDNDPLTNLSVNGTLFSASASAFRTAVRNNLVGPVVSSRGVSSKSLTWDVTTPGFYAPVLLTQFGQVFTLGDTTASDGRQHLKVLGENSFGFEEHLATLNSDFDYNDMTVQVLQITPLA